MKLKYDSKQQIGGLRLLANVEDGAAALAFFDPQHRDVLDRQQYGNEGARQKGRASLQDMAPVTISAFCTEIERALKRSGHLMLWVDKFVIAERTWFDWIPGNLRCVDLLHWDKGRMGMGRRLRCRSEYVVILQKQPIRAKGVWTSHRLDDTWREDADRARHPHAKPLALLQELIKTTTRRGELVLDPAAGGYGVLDACSKVGRRFLGCDVAEIAR